MCYYGSSYPRFIKKDQGHFNLMADLHTLVRNAQQNLYRDSQGKENLVRELEKVIANVRKGDYRSECEVAPLETNLMSELNISHSK